MAKRICKTCVNNVARLCKTCVFWIKFPDQNEKLEVNHGTCECPKFIDRSCGGIKVANDELAYRDCEGYKASLSTGENFGCVHHAFSWDEVEKRNNKK